MGSGSDTVRAALQHSTPLAFSLFFQNTDSYGPHLLEEYRKNFTPTARVPAPRVVLAVSAICAESSAAAQKLNTDLTNRGSLSHHASSGGSQGSSGGGGSGNVRSVRSTGKGEYPGGFRNPFADK